MFSHNKTSYWIVHIPDEQRRRVFEAARKLAPVLKEKFKGRRKEIEMRRKQEMEKRIEENARREGKPNETDPRMWWFVDKKSRNRETTWLM